MDTGPMSNRRSSDEPPDRVRQSSSVMLLYFRIFARDVWSFLVDTRFFGLLVPIAAGLIAVWSAAYSMVVWLLLIVGGAIWFSKALRGGNRYWARDFRAQGDRRVYLSINYKGNVADRLTAGGRQLACTIEDRRGVRYPASYVYGGGSILYLVYPDIFPKGQVVGLGIYTVSWSERDHTLAGPGKWRLLHVSQFEGSQLDQLQSGQQIAER